MKNYFSHDFNARSDEKIMNMIAECGVESYGIYWILVEMLYEHNGYLELKSLNGLAFNYHVEKKIILSVVKDFELFEYDDKRFWCNSVFKRINDMIIRTEKARNSAKIRWAQPAVVANAHAMQTHSESNTTKKDTSEFEDFWALYQRKGNKKSAEKAFFRLNKEQKQKAFSVVKKYVASTPEKQYRKDCEKWLNNHCFNDEIVIVKNELKSNGTNDNIRLVKDIKFDY